MRRLLALLGLVAVALAGCGGSSSSSGSSTLGTELSYFSSTSPFVLSIQTDPKSPAIQQAQQLVAKFPLAGLGQTYLKSKLSQSGINYDSDVRPLFGNPLMIGFAGIPTGRAAGSQVLIVWMTKDAGKLASLLQKALKSPRSIGTHDGAKLYQAGGATIALDGATLVASPSASLVTDALDRHAHGGGVSSTAYNQALTGLPQNALVEVFGNVAGLLSSPRTAKARQIPWVAALRSYATAVTASSAGITFQYHVDSTGASLGSAQLPIATGSTPPDVAGTVPIVAGIRDPAQIISFVQAAMQATGSPKYTAFLRRQAAARKRTGVDLTTLFPLLTGNMILESDTHAVLVRAVLSDPTTATATLSKLAAYPQAFSSQASHVTRLAGGLYAVPEGAKVMIVGVIGNQLVLGSQASPGALTAFAAAPTSPAPGAQGALAFRVSIPALLQIALHKTPPKLFDNILSSLGDLTGWTAATTSGMSGSASLALR